MKIYGEMTSGNCLKLRYVATTCSTATIADVALLAYTRLAPQGGFALSTRTHLTKWLARCEQRFAIEC